MPDVVDSSVWVFGLSKTCEPAEAVLESVIEGDIVIEVDAYIYNEVHAALGRSIDDHVFRSRCQTRFGEIVHGSVNVIHPSQSAVEELSPEDVRQDPSYRMFGEVFGIQPKDVPIIELAWQQPDEIVTVYTADRPLSRFDPEAAGLEEVRIEYVNCPA